MCVYSAIGVPRRICWTFGQLSDTVAKEIATNRYRIFRRIHILRSTHMCKWMTAPREARSLLKHFLAAGRDSREEHSHRMQRAAEWIEDEPQILKRHDSKQRIIARFSQNDGAVALAHQKGDVTFGDLPFDP
jgi:hypothetical protein